jgi:hypothetical protein
MTRSKITKLATSTAVATAMAWASAQNASGVPVTGVYLEDARCDALPNFTLNHELGNAAFFPINEGITVQVAPVPFTVCVQNDSIQNDWVVDITNVSGIAWTDLYFVADLGMRIGNADGNMIDVVNAPGVVTDAFRIDGTVTGGINNNLMNEIGGVVNEIFEPGETWHFAVSNFQGPTNPPPIMNTPGVFAGSDPIIVPPINTASILAIPVPEPTTIGAIGVLTTALLMRRPRRAT